ncbi:hypothetical protein BH20ACI4_BH20ACI4_11290 [soil metagenome]
MKKIILLTVVLLFASTTLFAQKNFLLKEASKNFDVKINIASCEEDICEGETIFYLSRKNQKKPFQTIKMANSYLELGENQKPTANLIELYGMNNSGIIFDDYNFDGIEDLAIRNGNDGAYNGPSYDVFLFSKTKNRFVANMPLTELASNNLGMFTVNKKTETLETFTKSGCCWHQTARYKVVNNRPKKVYVFTEDAMGGGENMKLITETLLPNGKWKKTTKSANTDGYYKDQ